MKFFIHPLIIPFYAFCLMTEFERQSYSLDITAMIQLMLVMFLTLVLFPYLTKFQFSFSKPDALWDIAAGFQVRLHYALGLTIFYLVLSYMIDYIKFFNTWGSKYIFVVYVLPVWINIFSGAGFLHFFKKWPRCFLAKVNFAQSAYFGALCGFIVIFGYKAAIDTFWPFVIALLLFSISSMYLINNRLQKFSHHLYCYVLGLIQAVIILVLCQN
ncbi:MAG: hypothetical protein II937_15050 [Bacteroidales bacterium]|nr:hypothetical protein [Bacteroidales bacterium]